MSSKTKFHGNQPPPSPQRAPNPVLQQASQQVVLEGRLHSGPLPSPDVMAGYEKIQVGFAERIMRMAEIEQAHRQTREAEALKSEISIKAGLLRERRLGQNYAFSIGIFALIVAGYLGTHGAAVVGSILGSGGIIGLVSAFLYSRKLEAPTQVVTSVMPATQPRGK